MNGEVLEADALKERLWEFFPEGVRECEVFGKGPTYVNTEPREGVLRVCANEAAIHTDRPDLIVCNDVEPLERIERHYSGLAVPPRPCPVLVPEYPHRGSRPRERYDAYPAYGRLLAMDFAIIPFNLRSTPKKNGRLVTVRSFCSSVNTAIEFVADHVPTVERIVTYGFAKQPGHHAAFRAYDHNPAADRLWVNMLRGVAEGVVRRRNERGGGPLELLMN
jgi:hypothetical protein